MDINSPGCKAPGGNGTVMTNSTLVVWLVVSLLVGVVAASPAQQLVEGTWTGTITPPNGPTIDVEYEVAGSGDELSIELVLPTDSFDFDVDRIVFEGIDVDSETLEFFFVAGNDTIDCSLAWDERGHYEGECADEGGDSGVMVMRPPEGGANVRDETEAL